MNLYAIIIGYSGINNYFVLVIFQVTVSGVSKSGSVRECREVLKELYEVLSINSIDNPAVTHSILDKFTEAGFIDQINVQSLI